MLSIPHMLIGCGADGLANYANGMQNISNYVRHSGMPHGVVPSWTSHLFNAPLYVYDLSHVTHTWTAYFPSLIDRSLPRNVNYMSMYIYFTGNHFNVVSGVRIT